MQLIFRITNLMIKVLQQDHEIFIIELNKGYENLSTYCKTILLFKK
jgi:hypothetical protein